LASLQRSPDPLARLEGAYLGEGEGEREGWKGKERGREIWKGKGR